jgi:hypothetical protein
MKLLTYKKALIVHVPTKRGAVRIGWLGDGYNLRLRRFFAGRTATGWSVYALEFCVCYAAMRSVTR